MRVAIRVSLVASVVVAALFIGYKVALESPFGAGAGLFLAILGVWAVWSLLSLGLYSRGRAELITNVWLALLFAAGTYLILDVALGFYLIERPSQVPDRIVHHRPSPNQSPIAITPEFRTTKRVNKPGSQRPGCLAGERQRDLPHLDARGLVHRWPCGER